MALTRLLQVERQVLEALLYTHRNSHGRTQYYQRLTTIRGYVRSLCDNYPSAPADFPNSGRDGMRTSEAANNNCKVGDIDSWPETYTKDLHDYVVHLHSSVCLCDMLAKNIQNVSQQLLMLIGQSYFMPFALTMLATCGRIRTLTKQMRATFCKSFKKYHSRVTVFVSQRQADIPAKLKDLVAHITPPSLVDPFDRMNLMEQSKISKGTGAAEDFKNTLDKSNHSGVFGGPGRKSLKRDRSEPAPGGGDDVGEVLVRPTNLPRKDRRVDFSTNSTERGSIDDRDNDKEKGVNAEAKLTQMERNREKQKKKIHKHSKKSKKKKKKKDKRRVSEGASFFVDGLGMSLETLDESSQLAAQDAIDDIFG